MQTARGNEHKLLAFFTMSDAAFAASGHGKDKWWTVLGVSNSVTTASVKPLRALFSTYDCLWREGTDWLRQLVIYGKVICGACFKCNKESGILQADTTSVERHRRLGKHKKRVETLAAKTPTSTSPTTCAVAGGPMLPTGRSLARCWTPRLCLPSGSPTLPALTPAWPPSERWQ